jgi:hypothetical protein
MVQLIVGRKGKGKTKCLLDKVNTEVKDARGNVCYLDKSTQHMFELNNRIRLINVTDYRIENTDQFLGFVAGIISQDHDLEKMFFDSFLDISHLKNADMDAVVGAVKKLQAYSDSNKVTFVLSVCADEADLPEELKSLIIESL